MPNSYRIRTQVGTNKTIQVNLDQDYDTLEVLSLAIYPNGIYTRSCANYGVICGRVFANKGYGIVNSRVSVFIPISEIDENNPLISTLYPYKSFEDFNEDGYKYNLLPYTQSHSGHVPVGTFPEIIDALTNPTVVEIYEKYYKFTAKTNDAGDYMIFGVPVGQYELLMQVDLSDIGEFSLTPQDLIRMGRATEAQVDGTKFKFSENYSELPQIVTLKKTVQVAPFFGQEGICQHYIVRADFDLTTEGGIEFRPTAVFMGSIISTTDKRKIKKRCRVPAKQGWLCDMTTGPGQIETIRQTIFTDDLGRPVLESFRLENDGKIIDENGTWMTELPMNLEFVYTDENGNRRTSPDGSVGVPTMGRYRFKVKWQQSPSLREEVKRAYFLVPNVKEYGWNASNMMDPDEDPGSENSATSIAVAEFSFSNVIESQTQEQLTTGPFNAELLPTNDYYNVVNTNNIESYTVLVDGVERPDYYTTIPMGLLTDNLVEIRFTIIDANLAADTTFSVDVLNTSQYLQQSSYAFSLNWTDYGDSQMIQEAIDCEDRFYVFQYNKVYTISQLIDRYTNRIFPQKSVQIKHILDDNCEGEYNTFPVNDVYYRFNIIYILANVILTIIKFSFFQILIFLHVLAFLWPVFAIVLSIVWAIQQLIYWICKVIDKLPGGKDRECKEPQELDDLLKNPFKNVRLPLFLYTEDGCERCRCKVVDQELDEESNTTLFQLIQNLEQIQENNISYLANYPTQSQYTPYFITPPAGQVFGASAIQGAVNNNSTTFDPFFLGGVQAVLAGSNTENVYERRLPLFRGSVNEVNQELFSTSLTLAEKINLFNTKAKYYDNLTVKYGSTNTPSPGNVGWNQVRVTWNPPLNSWGVKYHYDNLLVLITDYTGLTQGDLLSFQDPNKSGDLNTNGILLGSSDFSGTTGILDIPPSVNARYSNPDADSPDRLLTTNYVLYDGENRGPTTGTTCYPMDIEYFQVIKNTTLEQFLDTSEQIPPNYTNDRAFSLPWRFLRSNIGGYKTVFNNGTVPTTSQFFSNSFQLYRTFDSDNLQCLSACVDNTTHWVDIIDLVNSFSSATPLRVVFIQRGVDPNSPIIPMRFDLRRYYGLSTDWTFPAEIAGRSIELQSLVEGNFRMNIPIQPGGNSEVGNPTWITNNPLGLKLTRHNDVVDNNDYDDYDTSNIFFDSPFFTYTSNFIPFETKLPNYYSALDSTTYDFSYEDGFRWRPLGGPNMTVGGIKFDSGDGTVRVKDDTSDVFNAFTRKLLPIAPSVNDRYVPCRTSILGNPSSSGLFLFDYCPDVQTIPGSGVQIVGGGCCQHAATIFPRNWVYHRTTSNHSIGEVGGYWRGEYVEGGSLFALRIRTFLDNAAEFTYTNVSDCSDGNNTFNCVENPVSRLHSWGRDTAFTYNATDSSYYSPVYAAFPENVPPTPGFESFYSSPEDALRHWYVNPNHTVSMTSRNRNVFRTDRLPSSTSVQTDDNGSGYLLHQNSGFAIYRLSSCQIEELGGGEIDIQYPSVDVTITEVLPGPIAAVAESLTSCAAAVDLNSYYTDNEENPQIHDPNPYSTEPASGSDWLWFVRGTGCYNIVSKPLRSLFFHDIPDDPDGKKYSDIATVVEWIQRLKLTFSLCADVYSHTFSNNWINGTLYAFPFQNATTFNSQNQPTRRFCRDTIYFHDPLNTYYYRSSPWDGSNFVGRPRYSSSTNNPRGNIRNLLFPTTIIDLGPKTAFIQEIVFSDDYDGYIVPRIPTSTYQDVTDILNLFILSRLVNTSFIQQLFPLPDASGNEQGSDDPSVGSFFRNSRWQNGELFFAGLIPGLVDADYSQMISINSEFGINEFSPENYTNNDIIFAEDAVDPTYPYFGIFMSGDNQMRDYISPRRTIWNPNEPIPISTSAFTEISVRTQLVPFYQWNVYHNLDNPLSLFGTQSNNFITEFGPGPYPQNADFPNGFFSHRYQALDRFGASSQYFIPDVNNTNYYKGYLINYSAGTDSDGNPIVIPVNTASPLTRGRYTFGAPFHFYFGLIQGASAMDRFIQKYIDTTIVNE